MGSGTVIGKDIFLSVTYSGDISISSMLLTCWDLPCKAKAGKCWPRVFDESVNCVTT